MPCGRGRGPGSPTPTGPVRRSRHPHPGARARRRRRREDERGADVGGRAATAANTARHEPLGDQRGIVGEDLEVQVTRGTPRGTPDHPVTATHHMPDARCGARWEGHAVDDRVTGGRRVRDVGQLAPDRRRQDPHHARPAVEGAASGRAEQDLHAGLHTAAAASGNLRGRRVADQHGRREHRRRDHEACDRASHDMAPGGGPSTWKVTSCSPARHAPADGGSAVRSTARRTRSGPAQSTARSGDDG